MQTNGKITVAHMNNKKSRWSILTFCILSISHPGNGQLVRIGVLLKINLTCLGGPVDMYKQNMRRIGLLYLIWVYIFISILAVNRRMSYAVAMNMDNTVTGITWKKQGSLQILRLAYKKWRFQSWLRLSMLCNLTLLCRLLSIKINVSGMKCLFKILLVIGYASTQRHRPKTSWRNLWPVASNLTSGIPCVVVFHLIVLEFDVGQF